MDRREVPRLAAGAAAVEDRSGGRTAPGAARDAPAAGPLALTVPLRVRPGREEEFLRLLAPVLDAMRHEPSLINAVLHRDPEDPAHFLLYETWADMRDLLEVQMRRPYRAAHEARLPALLREPRAPRLWRPLRGDFTAFAR
jgi:quinol monooxygenase YgiN